MDSDNMRNTSVGGDLSGHNKSLLEHQEGSSRSLTDSLYDGPLNHIIRNHPKLFVRPRQWTKQHASFLHVICKEEGSWSSPSTQQANQQEDESLTHPVEEPNSQPQGPEETQHHTSPAEGADTSEVPLRVPSFRFPSLPHPHLNSHIGRLRSEDASIPSHRAAMDSLLVWKRRRPSRIWKALLNPDGVAPEPVETRSFKSEDSVREVRHRLRVRSIPLYLRYGKRSIDIGSIPQIYTLAGDTPYTQINSWRLIYLDRSQLGPTPLPKRERRRRRMAARLGIEVEFGPEPNTVVSSADGKDQQDGWPINEGYMAGLFIATAQQRQREIERKETSSAIDTQQEASQVSQNTPEVYPRYQILLTDNGEDSSCIHLYTAHVSDFLLEHFRHPSHSPQISPSEHEPHLIKIHHTTIPYTPYKSFRRRLRMTIMEFANGTAGGFFSDPNPGRDEEQERNSECVATTIGTVETESLNRPEDVVHMGACVVV